jgi:hypothetical protein
MRHCPKLESGRERQETYANNNGRLSADDAIMTPMSTSGYVAITPEQLAAVAAGNGFAHVEDPATHRVYLLVEQGAAPTLSDDYFREKVAAGIAERDRGECQPWNVEQLKAELRRRHAASSAQP